MKRKNGNQRRRPDIPPPGRKMSEMVLEFASEFINTAKTLEEKHTRLTVACSAWNMACSPLDVRTRMLERYISGYRSHCPGRTDEEMAAIRQDIETLIREKLSLFPTVTKQIANAQVRRTPDGDKIDVASVTVIQKP